MAKQSPTTRIVTKKHVARLERERKQIALIKWIAIGTIVFITLLLGYGYLKTTYFLLKEPVAKVNGDVITTGEWQERVRLERVRQLNLYQQYLFYQEQFGMDTTQYQQQILMTLQTPSIIGQQVLDQMVDELIIRQEAEKRGITVSEEELNTLFHESYGFFPDGTYTPTVTATEFSLPTLSSEQLTLYPSTAISTMTSTSTAAPTNTPDLSVTPTATFTAAPATPTFVPELPTATATPYTVEGFNKEYEQTMTDLKAYEISEATLRSVYEIQLIRKKLLDELTTDTSRTETQVWARHILVRTEAEAKAVEELLANGVDFANTAKKYSTDTGSGPIGGDLGWFGKGMMVAEFEDAAFNQNVGEIGQPVQSQFGYHIIQVLGREELPVTEEQYQQKRETAFGEWLTAAKETAAITTFDVWTERVPLTPEALNTPTPE